MNCPKCQYALSAFDKSCPRCAQTQNANTTTIVAPSPAPAQYAAQEPNGCVACGSPTIQKVSGLYRGGVWSAESVGVGVGYGRTSGGQSFTTVSTSHAVSAGGTGLAQALAPPQQPHRFNTSAEITLFSSMVASLAAWIVCWWTLAGTPLLVVLHSPLVAYILVASATTLIPIAAAPFALKSVREQKAQLTILLQRWRTVTSRWQRLYYCSRCDRVFNPQTGRYAPSHATSSILYDDILNGTNTL